MSKEAMKLALEALALRFSEGWHEGIKIDASDIMLLNDAAQALAEQPALKDECAMPEVCPEHAHAFFAKQPAQQEPLQNIPSLTTVLAYLERLVPSEVYTGMIDVIEDEFQRKEQPAPVQQEPDLAESFRTELDKLSQRNYELRMENSSLKASPQPAQRKPWVELDHDDIHALMNEFFYPGMQPSGAHLANFAKAIETKLKEKNT